jgi:predicted outer membrane repeat protein
MNKHRFKLRFRVILLIAVVALFFGAAPTLASVCTLADHIRSANTNTAVGYCPAGTSHDIITLAEDITLTEPLPPITGTITIEGGGHTISGDRQFRIFDVQGGNLTINNLILTKGRGAEEEAGALNLRNGGVVTVNNSTFLSNYGSSAGAIYTMWPGPKLTINGASFIDNSSYHGGGALTMWGGAVSISGSSFVNNRNRATGGAVFVQEGDHISITNSTFARNKSRRGGAIGGGHIKITLTHLTMVDNLGSVGKAMYWYDGSTQVRLRNSIVVGKFSDLCHGRLFENVGNIIEDGSCGSRKGGDALLADKTGSPAYFPLSHFSSAVDNADARFCPATDQNSAPRPQGDGCDIGAIESTRAKPALVVAPEICPLDDQIIAANTDTAVGNCQAGKGADTITLLRDFTLQEPLPPITSEITIDGAGHTISGNKQFRIFDVASGRLTIQNATLAQGYASDGGAIRLRDGAHVAVENVIFKENSAGWGGAITSAGANAKLAVNRSSFVGNTSNKGGGAVFIDGGNVAVTGSTFIGNSAELAGGAIYAAAGKLNILNSTISGNMAQHGAGLHIRGADATMTHLTVVENQARFASGGGIYIEAGSARLRNSIVFGNTAAEDCLGRLEQSMGNLSGDGTCSSGVRGNPYLGKLAGAPAHHPLYGDSPAIDAADASFCAEIDQVGRSRAGEGGCDIGAIEASVDGPAPAGPINRILRPSADCTLHDLILAANGDAPAGGCPAGSGADIIELAADLTLSAPLPPISSDVYLRGNGHTISGNKRFRIFEIASGSLTIKDLRLVEGGRPQDKGGAIRLDDGALTVADAIFSDNAAGWGGAIAMLGGRFTLYNSLLLDNTAENRGGGIWIEGGCEVMADSVLRRNAAVLGERQPGPMHDHFGSAIEWGSRAGYGCGDDVFASNIKVYDD